MCTQLIHMYRKCVSFAWNMFFLFSFFLWMKIVQQSHEFLTSIPYHVNLTIYEYISELITSHYNALKSGHSVIIPLSWRLHRQVPQLMRRLVDPSRLPEEGAWLNFCEWWLYLNDIFCETSMVYVFILHRWCFWSDILLYTTLNMKWCIV